MKSIEEHPMQTLQRFLPEGSFDLVVQYLQQYKVHFTVTRARKSVLGDYRHAFKEKNHRISVNGNLGKYEFLITLLHELAHLLAFEKFGNRIEAHGGEWKNTYSNLLIDFVEYKIFPTEIEKALQKSIINPSATANGESNLLLVLRSYDGKLRPDIFMLQELEPDSLFQISDGRIFKKLERMRKRFRCIEMKTGLIFLFSPVYEVKKVKAST